MKVKIGTQIEEDLLQSLKVYAARERLAMADVIQTALERYLRDKPTKTSRRDSLLRILGSPTRLSDEQFAEIIESDYYDQ
ncbi:MAG: hypothetical protein ACKO2G_05825 [Verrucomicrobiales bacterium]